jgi:hypothetical protein
VQAKYKLFEFEKLVTAFRTGNVALFDEALEENQDFYIKKVRGREGGRECVCV